MKSKRKPSGGKRHSIRRCDKKLSWKGGNPAMTQVGKEDKRVVARTRGKNRKVKQKTAKFANVTDLKTKKTRKFEIASVVSNNADRQYARRNIITKGAEIEVKDGSSTKKAVVTSKPGQSGIVSAVFR